MPEQKRAFLSYSHADYELAEKIAKAVQDQGISVWFDKWDLNAGDSIIEKIFREGLENCDAFLVLLSKRSVNSKWVKQEMDTALVQRIQGITRVIPLLIEETQVPTPLRALVWVDLTMDFEGGIRKVVQAIYGHSVRPPVGPPPSYVHIGPHSVGGLSPLASSIGNIFLRNIDGKNGFEIPLSGSAIKETIPGLTPEEINEGIEELEEYGLVKLLKSSGTSPYTFYSAEPTYALFIHYKDEGLSYDPEEDLCIVAAAINSQGSRHTYVNGETLANSTALSSARINRAIEYLSDFDLVDVLRYMGTAPYSFGEVAPTWKTKQFLSQNCG